MLGEVLSWLKGFMFWGVVVMWPGFLLQRVLLKNKRALDILVYSTGFGLASMVIMCPLLDALWEISIVSIGAACGILSGILIAVAFYHDPPVITLKVSGRVRITRVHIVILLLVCYAFLLRSSTLFDPLPRGQDAWTHLSFISYIYQYKALPEVLPWIEPAVPVTLDLYPPGVHCVGALLSQAAGEISFSLLKAVFIGMGTATILSVYVGVRNLFDEKTALLSASVTAVFIPHMIMTSEITAQSLAIFMVPLILYVFYMKKWVAAGILLGAVILMHHLSAFAAVLSVGAVALTLSSKKLEYLGYALGTGGTALAVSAPWWIHVPFRMSSIDAGGSSSSYVGTGFFSPYLSVISPLTIVFCMIGVYIALTHISKKKTFIFTWALVLFIASQPVFPIDFLPWRFPAFFILPGSVLASLGILSICSRIRTRWCYALLFVALMAYPQQFWPGTDNDNLQATQWIDDSTLDPYFYVYGRNYTYIYPLSYHRMHIITDFDAPFSFGLSPAYFYDDADWVPHTLERFGQFDRIYSCGSIIIHRIE
ncbi:MAG: hypothetical protein HXS49_10500 [Theionarchaea archaeon]|nr:hypothetical protein [Theionarchaea archaeon]MBU7040515.1 hypothetical protein [Theionarchaea archaeon]